MHRLSGNDANFLYLETPSVHMHIGFTAIFEQPPGEEFNLKYLRALVSSRLDRLPVLQRRLREVPFGLHHPVWIDDSRFDVEYHVRRLVAAAPGGRAELGEIVADILSRPLDRSRPLWELDLVDGLADGQFALVTKVHHAAIDGVSGIELMNILLSPEPSPIPDRARPAASTQTIPNDTQMLLDAVGDLIRHPPWFTRSPLDAPPTLTSMLTPAGKLPSRWKSPLNATITPHRAVAFIDVALDAVRTVKDRVGCTVNDVVLALCAGALRRFIDRTGLTNAPSLVAGVPVSIRTEAGTGHDGQPGVVHAGAARNGQSHTARTTPGDTRPHHGSEKRHDPVAARALMDWAVAGGPPLVAQAARLYSQLRVADVAQPDFHVVVSNIPGPLGRLYCANSSMTALYPTGPLSEGAGLNITLGSYAGQLNISLITCPEVVPEGARIARDLHDELAELLVATQK